MIPLIPLILFTTTGFMLYKALKSDTNRKINEYNKTVGDYTSHNYDDGYVFYTKPKTEILDPDKDEARSVLFKIEVLENKIEIAKGKRANLRKLKGISDGILSNMKKMQQCVEKDIGNLKKQKEDLKQRLDSKISFKERESIKKEIRSLTDKISVHRESYKKMKKDILERSKIIQENDKKLKKVKEELDSAIFDIESEKSSLHLFRTCVDCGDRFEISESEIRYYLKKDYEFPKRCKFCRDCRRKSRY